MSAADKIASKPGETVLKGRRGTLYHVKSALQLQQQQGTALDDLHVRRRFSASRYSFSPAGLLSLLVILIFLAAGTLFLALDSCPDTPSWYTWLYPLASLVAFISAAFLYTMFMLGMAEDRPSFWVKLDLALMLPEAVAIIAVSIITITECKTAHMNSQVLGPLGLTGAALMAASAAATYIMWRYRNQEPPPSTPAPEEQKPRVSHFA
ncbi:uncharacterized protein [Periplaneta americana]